MNPGPVAARVRGVTVVELVVALAVVAILTVIAVPSMRDFINENRSRSTMNQLVADLNFARVEAIKRNARVLICPRVAGASTCATVTTAWINGWLVCYDADADGNCDATAANDPNPMKIANAIHDTMTLTNPATLVRFNPVGSAAAQVIFTLTSATTVRTGTVAATGSVSSKKN